MVTNVYQHRPHSHMHIIIYITLMAEISFSFSNDSYGYMRETKIGVIVRDICVQYYTTI